MVDARNGFAFPAVNLAIAELPGLAVTNGIAAAGITRSHHFGVAGRHVERLAETGLVALAFGNTPKAMAPWTMSCISSTSSMAVTDRSLAARLHISTSLEFHPRHESGRWA